MKNWDWRFIGLTIRAIGEIAAFGLLIYHLFHSKIDSEKPGLLIGVVSPLLFLAIALVINIIVHLKQQKDWKIERSVLVRSSKLSYVIDKINRAFNVVHTTYGIDMQNSKNSIDLIRSLELGSCKPDDYKNKISEIVDKYVEKDIRIEDYRGVLKSFCDDLSEAFTQIVSVSAPSPDAKCSICIKPNKISINAPKERKLFTLVRDRNSSNRYGAEFDSKVLISYENNTAFSVIYDNLFQPQKQKYYFHNSLPAAIDEGYQNESFNKKGVSADYLKKMKYDQRRLDQYWPLSYKSTIVAPIIQVYSKDDITLHGFICLDCQYEFVFNEQLDVPILIGCAEGLSNIISEFQRRSI